jgi:hypothetical protein
LDFSFLPVNFYNGSYPKDDFGGGFIRENIKVENVPPENDALISSKKSTLTRSSLFFDFNSLEIAKVNKSHGMESKPQQLIILAPDYDATSSYS